MKRNFLAISLAAMMLTACGEKASTSTDLSPTETSNIEASTEAKENLEETTTESKTTALQEIEDISTIEEQLELKSLKTLDGEVCILITNNSNSTIDELEVQINYKDTSGKTIDLDTDGHDMVLPGSTVVSKMNAPKEYSDYEITSDIELDCYPHYQNHADKVSISTNMGNDCVIVEITNNDDVTIDEIEYIVVFYKGNDVAHVDYPQDIYDVEPGKTVTEKVSLYGLDYDNYEVFLNQAHTF